MTRRAPSARTRSVFAALHTPVTSAPSARAICTANVPTPPPAPITATVCPVSTRAMSRRACRAVAADVGTTAACSNVRLAGFGASVSSCPRAYSAKAPLQAPNTSSPGRSRVTPAPTAATRPATSCPATRSFGRRSPKPISRTRYGRPVMRCQTPGSRPAAWTSTSTSRSPTRGRSTSRSCSTSAEPYSSWTIACIGAAERECPHGPSASRLVGAKAGMPRDRRRSAYTARTLMSCPRPSKSIGFRVYSGSACARAVAPMSRSPKRRRPLRPCLRSAA